MIRISQLKLPVNHTKEDLTHKILKTLHISEQQMQDYQIVKQSIDARKKPSLFYVYTVDVTVDREKQILKKQKNNNIAFSNTIPYQFPVSNNVPLLHRPVIVGSGPAGLFCAYMLAKNGYRPLLIERGAPVEQRMQDVDLFWQTGKLDTVSNVQFGEGGAGTFSDGKLNTLVKDPVGRNRKVLEIFVQHGAPKEILYVNKPHIGTDILTKVVKNIREDIVLNGGNVLFYRQMEELCIENGKVTGIKIRHTDDQETTEIIETNLVILAIGHSARDTFEMLYEKGIPMSAKSFAVGVRVEHPQTMINYSQYGLEKPEHLQAAAYKVAVQLENGRGVYSFCMCPGGYVVNASSEEHRLAVNGMSYHDRDGKNANSAIIVTVTPEDYGTEHPLAGMQFQRKLEEKAFQLGNGKIPVQLFKDFCENKTSSAFGDVMPQMKGTYTFANVRSVFPEEIASSLEEGIQKLDHKIHGFSKEDTLLSAVESRTSSPVRIIRNGQYESEIQGLFPCGEGAGYAGGITSAAMDGIKVAEKIATDYGPFQ